MGVLGEGLKAHWSAQGRRFRPGAPEESLAAFEVRYGVRLPPDLRDYFSTVDGMDAFGESNPFGLDKDLFRFWPLNEVERATESYSPDHFLKDQASFFLFADHSIALPSFAIRLAAEAEGDNYVLAIYSDGGNYEATKVADSFTNFVGKYLADETSRSDLSIGWPNSTEESASRWQAAHLAPKFRPT